MLKSDMFDINVSCEEKQGSPLEPVFIQTLQKEGEWRPPDKNFFFLRKAFKTGTLSPIGDFRFML